MWHFGVNFNISFDVTLHQNNVSLTGVGMWDSYLFFFLCAYHVICSCGRGTGNMHNVMQFPSLQKTKRGGPVAEWLGPLMVSARSLVISLLWVRALLGSHVRQAKFCLRVIRWFFSGISHFHPTLRLTRLKMSEINLTGHKTQIKKKKLANE